MIICWIDWSGQPNLHFACDDSWSTPDWNQPTNKPAGVYLADNERFYAFDRDKVTCEPCKEKIRESQAKSAAKSAGNEGAGGATPPE